jgi:aspartyl aminopeptidase
MSATDFVSYLNAAVTSFHSVDEVKRRLRAAGFTELDERKEWKLQPGGKHYFSRNGSAICAFAVGGAFSADTSGAVVIGAHTDSPCLKLKPSSTLEKEGWVAPTPEASDTPVSLPFHPGPVPHVRADAPTHLQPV